MNTTIETEIVIIGAGIAGCIAAMALAPSHQVVLIDKLDTPLDRIGECWPEAASRILKKLKLLDDFEKTIHKSQYEQSNQNLHLINKGTQSYWGSDEVLL